MDWDCTEREQLRDTEDTIKDIQGKNLRDDDLKG